MASSRKIFNRRTLKAAALFLSVSSFLILFGQQCAKVPLELMEEVEFASLGQNPYRLDPPLEKPNFRRLIFFVDMSQSMISGPCVQDVDAKIGFSTNPAHEIYDPNKGTGNPADHRASGVDCKVNPTLPIRRSSVTNRAVSLLGNPPVFHETHLGMDHESTRLKVLRKWIEDSRANNPPIVVDRTKVMIIPVSGGISQLKLDEKWRKITNRGSLFSFIDLKDPTLTNLLQWLEEEQALNMQLSMSDDPWRYENRTMGTSAPGALLKSLYSSVNTDMRSQNSTGDLTNTDYQFVHLTDGLLTPVQSNIEDVLRLNSTCSSCAADPSTCTGTCGALVKRMTDAWGDPKSADIAQIDFNFGLLQTLPNFFGAGFFRADFVQLRSNRLKDAYPSDLSYYDRLKPKFEARSMRFAKWELNKDEIPFRLIGEASKKSAYDVTNLYVLSTNVRLNKAGVLSVDSDGDGLFDSDEENSPFLPNKQRTNGVCLDSFAADPVFADRCVAQKMSGSCDPQLDSDGDSLNECEEALLGSNPFDFDTDNDGIPDSLEWLYGFNPLVSDVDLDINGDGFSNAINFSSGLGPNHYIASVSPHHLSRYELNSKGKELIAHPSLGEISVELLEVIVHHVPVKTALPVDPSSVAPLYKSRISADPTSAQRNVIPYSRQLLGVSPAPNRNTVIALARIVDTTNPERAYWRIYKTEIPIVTVYSQPHLDLSKFELIGAFDRTD